LEKVLKSLDEIEVRRKIVKLNDLEAKRYNINTTIVVHGQLQGMYEKYN
jgi:hypothetical protein